MCELFLDIDPDTLDGCRLLGRKMANCFEGNRNNADDESEEDIDTGYFCCIPCNPKVIAEDEFIIKINYGSKRKKIPANLFDYVKKYLEEGSDRIALHDVFAGDTYTYKEVNAMVETIAQNLYQHFGFQPGDRFACYSFNLLEYILVLLAIWKLKGVYVGIHPQLKAEEVSRELILAECKLLYAHAMNAASAVQAVKGTQVKTIFVKSEEAIEGCTASDILMKKVELTLPLPKRRVSRNALCAVLFSSGTTGLPKGVMLSVKHFIDPERPPVVNHDQQNQDRVMYYPLCHIVGCATLLMTLHHHESMHLMTRFDLQEYLKCTVEYKSRTLLLVTPVALLLAKMDLDPSLDLSCVKVMYCSGAPLHVELIDALHRKFGPELVVKQVYGMTEHPPLVAGTPDNDSPYVKCQCPPYSVGLPAQGCEIKICSRHTGRALPRGEKGEIYVRSNSIMDGYLKDPEATKEVIDEGGWFHTGDYGYVDANGFLFVLDRIVDLISCDGHTVTPTELETLLLRHDAIADVGVVGIPDEQHGAVPYAWVTLKPHLSLTVEELQTWVAEQVEDYKQLRGGVKFVPLIPKSHIGKILHREIRLITMVELNKL